MRLDYLASKIHRLMGAPVCEIAKPMKGTPIRGKLTYGLVTVNDKYQQFHGQTGYYDDDTQEPCEEAEIGEYGEYNEEDLFDLAIVYFKRPFADDYELIPHESMRPATKDEAEHYLDRICDMEELDARVKDMLAWGEKWRTFALRGIGAMNSESLATMPDHNPPGYPGRNADE